MKLPVAEILAEAFHFPWRHRRDFASGIAVPLTGLMTLLIAWQYCQPDDFAALGYGVYVLLYFFLFAWLAVGCHRLVLLKPDARSTDMKWSRRESRFLVWLIGLTLLLWIVTLLLHGVLSAFQSTLSGGSLALLAQVAQLPGWYVFARLSLVFPAIALDHRTDFGHAWNLSERNGGRMFLLVCLFPWALDTACGLLLSQADSHLSSIVYGIAAPLLFVVEICALSLAYRFFTRRVG